MTATVYFVECAGQIKIGFTKNVAARLRKLSAGNVVPLSLIGTVEGSQKLERAIHARLAAYRNNGEWFTDCPEVRETVSSLMTSGAIAIGFSEPQVDIPEETGQPELPPLPTYRFMNGRKLLARLCIRMAHMYADLAEWFAPWMSEPLR